MPEFKTVLIVDDSKMARIIASRIVIGVLPDCEIVLADGGNDALATLDKMTCEPDLALIDFNMPGMNGLELADRIRDRLQSTHFIICTANIQDRVRDRVDRAGIEFMEKPLTRDKLTELVAKSGS